jgi:competence protein ComEC
MILSLRRVAITLVAGLLLCLPAFAKKNNPLRIFFIDVEGGQSTLVVTPAGKSVLIDTGYAGSRDAGRIQAAAKAAHLRRLDYVLITHYHPDHVGGVPDLLQRMKVGVFVDHGPNQRKADYTQAAYDAYEKAIARSHHIALEPGQGLPLKSITFRVLTGAGKHIAEPLPGAGEANRYCDSEAPAPDEDASENSQSLGILITYGKFQFLDLGDLTENKELELLCPNNFIGTVDLYLSTHHGVAPDNPKALVWAVHPRVAILDNGAHKGGSPEAWQIIHDSPGLAGFWQLHYAVDGGRDHNVKEDYIANVDDADGHFIEATVEPDGSFTVLNSRNGYSRKYGAE